MCLVYDVANLYQLRALMEACRQYADRHATDILQSDAFLQLSPVMLNITVLIKFMYISN
jgi:BTB/POZ domain-containing protein 9